jgi:glucose/mannose-6-phosphate isomerase
MTDLDDLTIHQRLDPGGMLAQLKGLPQQCHAAWNKALQFKLPTEYRDADKVVILGMGGSAIGGDLLRSLTHRLNRPLVFVLRDYDLPPFVDNRTLVIASSYSGNTEETLSAFSQALNTRCHKLALTTGGKLREMAAKAGVPVFTIDHVSPPRAALGYSLMPLIAFFQQLGFFEDKSAEVAEMLKTLEELLSKWNEAAPTDSNLAKQLTRSLHGKIVVIYGAGILSEVAHRWKTQINENSKAWAFFETLPELDHNAVVGYELPHELASNIFVVLLRSSHVHPRTLVRYEVTAELLKQNGISHQFVDAYGESEFAHMMGLVYLGDWVSYYLALLYQVDPTPVRVIDYLKKRLSEAN